MLADVRTHCGPAAFRQLVEVAPRVWHEALDDLGEAGVPRDGGEARRSVAVAAAAAAATCEEVHAFAVLLGVALLDVRVPEEIENLGLVLLRRGDHLDVLVAELHTALAPERVVADDGDVLVLRLHRALCHDLRGRVLDRIHRLLEDLLRAAMRGELAGALLRPVAAEAMEVRGVPIQGHDLKVQLRDGVVVGVVRGLPILPVLHIAVDAALLRVERVAVICLVLPGVRLRAAAGRDVCHLRGTLEAWRDKRASAAGVGVAEIVVAHDREPRDARQLLAVHV
mmetsp:Transcript_91882/g.256802  ORF Transcript_91882/g.256802 Transcript_91882/m.256802 type:complete len:282 (+) Transcript_91882:430-1275(+)